MALRVGSFVARRTRWTDEYANSPAPNGTATGAAEAIKGPAPSAAATVTPPATTAPAAPAFPTSLAASLAAPLLDFLPLTTWMVFTVPLTGASSSAAKAAPRVAFQATARPTIPAACIPFTALARRCSKRLMSREPRRTLFFAVSHSVFPGTRALPGALATDSMWLACLPLEEIPYGAFAQIAHLGWDTGNIQLLCFAIAPKAAVAAQSGPQELKPCRKAQVSKQDELVEPRSPKSSNGLTSLPRVVTLDFSIQNEEGVDNDFLSPGQRATAERAVDSFLSHNRVCTQRSMALIARFSGYAFLAVDVEVAEHAEPNTPELVYPLRHLRDAKAALCDGVATPAAVDPRLRL